MSHGKRMLEAQAQKARTSGTLDDGSIDDGHLRNVHRALNDDGTPVRPSRGSARRIDNDDDEENTGETNNRSSAGELRTPERARGQRQGTDAHLTPALSSPPPRAVGAVSLDASRRSIPQVGLGGGRGGGRAALPTAARRPLDLGSDEQCEDDGPEKPRRAGQRRPSLASSAAAGGGREAPAVEPPRGNGGGSAWTPALPARAARADLEDSPRGERRQGRSRSASRGSAPRYPTDRIRLHGVGGSGGGTPPRVALSSKPSHAESGERPPVLFGSRPPLPTRTPAAAAAATQREQGVVVEPAASSSSSSGSRSPSTVSVEGPQSERSCVSDSGSRSRSPPPVTHTAGYSTRLQKPTAAAPLRPVTAALRPTPTASNNEAAAASADDDRVMRSNTAGDAVGDGAVAALPHRPPPLPLEESSAMPLGAAAPTSTPSLVPLSPASPPLRAGVSPRMLPRHPTHHHHHHHHSHNHSTQHSTASASASFAASRAASASNTVAPTPPSSQPFSQPAEGQPAAVGPPPPSPPPQQQQQQPSSYRLSAAAPRAGAGEGGARSPPVENSTESGVGLTAEAALVAMREDRWHSIPPSPLPPSQGGHSDGAGAAQMPPAPLSPLSVSMEGLPPPATTLPSPPELAPQPPASSFTPSAAAAAAAYHRHSLLTNTSDPLNYPYMRDFSGFHNTGNDCYACSALTMLLRSCVFRRALLSSPLLLAFRRYEAAVTGRPEKRIVWTSGYVDALQMQKAELQQQQQRLLERKRPRTDADAEDVTVADVCGLPAPLLSKTAETEAATPPPPPPPSSAALQQTLAFIETLDLDELRDVLAYDWETERVPLTLHTALAALTRLLWRREHLTCYVNSHATKPAERQRLLERRVYSDNDRTFDGQVYTCGIRLNAVASLFCEDFFLGEQEDAHELFVALMAKLETEAVDFQKRCADVHEARQLKYAVRKDEADDDKEQREWGDAPTSAMEGSSSSLVYVAPPRPAITTALADAWINALVQTRLLNIIRCRSRGCRHEIVSDEICVNLSLHIPEEGAEESEEEEEEEEEGEVEDESDYTSPAVRQAHSPNPQQQQQQSVAPYTGEDEEEDDDFSFPSQHPPHRHPTPVADTRATASSSSPTASPPPVCSVRALLRNSMAYEPLSDYRCDACGAKSSQYQGGCFYTRPPPLLVLQLKRFLTDFVNGMLSIQKNSRCVAVEDELVVYALPSREEMREIGPGQRLRVVTPADLQEDGYAPAATAAATAAQGRAKESRRAMEGRAADRHPASEHRCFFYDADHKCFTSVGNDHETVPPADGDHSAHHEDEEKEKERVATPMKKEAGDVPPPSDNAPPSSLSSPQSSQAKWLPAMDAASTYVVAIRSVYRLRSCVLHLGQSLHFGHYVADFAVDGEEAAAPSTTAAADASTAHSHRHLAAPGNRGSETAAQQRRRWRRANDERVDLLSEEGVRTRRAGRSDMYLLLYEKVTEEWVRCPVTVVLPRPVYPPEKKEKQKKE